MAVIVRPQIWHPVEIITITLEEGVVATPSGSARTHCEMLWERGWLLMAVSDVAIHRAYQMDPVDW